MINSSFNFFRLDGQTSAKARQELVESFNDPDNTSVQCVLISTRAGSLGINLPAANRVVIFDGSWNPTHDLQALFRAWRYEFLQTSYSSKVLTTLELSLKFLKNSSIGREFCSTLDKRDGSVQVVLEPSILVK